MKKKLFTILTLLVLCVTGAWAQNAITVTWPMVDSSNKLSKAGTASVADIVTVNNATLSTDKLTWDSQRELKYSDGNFYAGGIKNGQDNTSDNSTVSTGYAEFSFDLPEGVTFTPTNFSFKAGRQGTDNGCIQGSFAYTKDAAAMTATTEVYQPARSDKGVASNPQSINITGADAVTEGNRVSLKIYFGGKNKDKTIYLANVVITGTYTKSGVVTYALTTEASPAAGGTITRSPNQAAFSSGKTVTLTATPNYAYEFVNWTKDNVVVSSDAEFEITTVAAEETYVANFNALPTYGLTITASPTEGGTVSKSPVHDTYLENDAITLTATPKTGYAFDNWTKGGSVVSTSATYNISKAAEAEEYTANFRQLYSITYSKGEVENIVGNVPSLEYVEPNTNYTLSAAFFMYKEGYTLSGWNDGTNDHAIGSNMTITGNVTLTPVYVANTVELGDVPATVNWTFSRDNGAPILNCEGSQMEYVQRTTISGVAYEAAMHVDTRKNEVIPGYTSNGKLNNTNNTTCAQVNKGTKFTIPVYEGTVITYTTTNGTPSTSDVTFGGKTGLLSEKVFKYTYTGTTGTIDIIAQNSNFYPSGISVSYPKYVPGSANPSVITGNPITWDFTDLTAKTFDNNKSYSFKADDDATEMRYTAGSSDAIVAKDGSTKGYLKENGTSGSSSNTDIDGTTPIAKTRLIRLFVTGQGTLRINCTNTVGVYNVFDSNTTNTAVGSSLISSYTANTTSDEITVTNGLWIETSTKGYINSIVWTPITDDITLTTSDNMAGWRAFNPDGKGYTLDANTKAYIVTEAPSNNSVSLVELAAEGGDIPGNTPVILYTTSTADSHKMTLTKKDGVANYAGTANLLKATTESQDLSAGKCRLGFGADGVGFYPYAAASAPKGIVYLDAAPATGAKGYVIVFDNGTTGINGIEEVAPATLKTRKVVKNGRLVIETANGEFTVSGARVK